MTLEDRIYCLQRTSELPHELRDSLMKADKAYLQNRDEEAVEIVNNIELECHARGISIYKPASIW
jgi:hypothetical protein